MENVPLSPLMPVVAQTAPLENNPPAGDGALQQETDAEFVARVKPHLGAIETVREEKYKSFLTRRKIGAVVCMVLMPFTGFLDYLLLFTTRIFSSSNLSNHAGGLTLALAGAVYWWVTGPKRAYVHTYKTEIMPRIASALGLSAYEEHGKIPEGQMEPSKILPAHNRYLSEDYFAGRYKGADVRFAQIKLKQEEGSGKNRHEKIVFSGLALLVAMPRGKFNGRTLMVARHAGIFEWFEEKNLGLQKADLVDPAFEKKYTVFTDDQVEARYLLDPMMIERVQKLADIYNATDVKVSYYDDRVLVLLKCTRNLFEPPDIIIPATDLDALMALKKEVEKTLDLIDCVDAYLQRPPAPAA